MAKAITQITRRAFAAADEQAQAQQEILAAAAKHKESILLLLDVVNDLKEAGLLDAAHGFISNRHKIGVIGINQLNKSGAQRLIKNGMGALQFLGGLEPGTLEPLLGALAAGVERAAAKPAASAASSSQRLGAWGMMRALKEPEIKTSLAVLFNFLRGMGGFLQRKS